MKITKHLILCLILVLSFSCSNSDDTVIRSNISFEPPSWIQGTWFEEGAPSGYKFTSDDIIRLELDSNNNIVNEESRSEYWSTLEGASVNEFRSANIYNATVKIGGQEYEFYEFQKTDENTIQSGTSLTWIRQ